MLYEGIEGRGKGCIEVICGGMFSGKTEELIRRVRTLRYAKRRVMIFTPAMDTRYEIEAVVSHNGSRVQAQPVQTIARIMAAVDADPTIEVVAIDEVQFLENPPAETLAGVQAMANRGLRVICAGLDQDYKGRPFEPMPHLLAVAEYITKELAICVVCGNPANRSQRIVSRADRVVVGAAGAYEARCRRCHVTEPVEATAPQSLKLL